MKTTPLRLRVPPQYSGLEDQDGNTVSLEWVNDMIHNCHRSRRALKALTVAYRKATGLDSSHDPELLDAEYALKGGEFLG